MSVCMGPEIQPWSSEKNTYYHLDSFEKLLVLNLDRVSYQGFAEHVTVLQFHVNLSSLCAMKNKSKPLLPNPQVTNCGKTMLATALASA